MAHAKYILILGTIMSSNLWSPGVSSEHHKYGNDYQYSNQRENHYEPQENYQLESRSGDEPNERSIFSHNSAQGVQIDSTATIRNQTGSYKILNGYHVNNYVKINRRGQIQEPSPDRVIFPGPTATYSERFVPEVPEKCKKLGICTSVSNYPDELVKNIISKLEPKGSYFQVDELDTPELEIVQRLGPPEETMELCESKEQIMYPQAAKDGNGEWHMVINPENNLVQGFRVELCSETARNCASFVSFQVGYQAKCIQKYVKRNMQTLDPNGQMIERQLTVPSCCSCVAQLL